MSIDANYRNSSRRHFLRGVGVALALPWMESLPIFAQAPAAGAGAAAASTPPLRLGIVFFSNGVEPAHWWAKGAGASMELGPGLTPMMPHREDMLFINGLFNQTALASTSPHLGRMNVLSGMSSLPVSGDVSWRSVRAGDLLRENRIWNEDSAETRREKVRRIREWWRAEGGRHHQWWRVWTSACPLED